MKRRETKLTFPSRSLSLSLYKKKWKKRRAAGCVAWLFGSDVRSLKSLAARVLGEIGDDDEEDKETEDEDDAAYKKKKKVFFDTVN